jgi:hypothetical protein
MPTSIPNRKTATSVTAAQGITAAFLGFIIAILFWLPATYFKAYVAVKLWALFAPSIPGLPPTPSIYAAAGLMFIVQAFLPRPGSNRDGEKRTMFHLAMPFVWPACLLMLGHLWHGLGWGL